MMGTPIKISENYYIVTEEEMIKFRPYIAWGLIIIGVLLVWNSYDLGIKLVRHGDGPNYSWSPDEALNAAWNIRFLGAMAFIAGLWERLLTQISHIKVN